MPRKLHWARPQGLAICFPRRYPQLPRALTDGVHPRDHLIFALLVTGLVIRLPRVKQQALYTVSEKMNVVISCSVMSQSPGVSGRYV